MKKQASTVNEIDIECKLCGTITTPHGLFMHLACAHIITPSEYIERFGEFIKKITRKTGRPPKPITCKLCNVNTTTAGIATHLRNSHQKTVDEYVQEFGEFRKKKLEANAVKEKHHCEVCKICNDDVQRTDTDLSFHVRLSHNLSKREYVVQYILVGVIPSCKCGCGNEVKLLDQYPYYREFLSGHNSKGSLNPRYGKEVTEDTRTKMKEKANARIAKSKEDGIPLAYHRKEGIAKRAKAQSQKYIDRIQLEFDITVLETKRRAHNTGYYTIECNQCKHQFEKFHGLPMNCPICKPSPRSILENEIYESLVSLLPEPLAVKRNAKVFSNSKQEIDFYIASQQLGIEFHGLYYHGEMYGGKPPDYHLNKLNMATADNIRLIQIFEDEWVHKQDIVKSKLAMILGIFFGHKVYGRQCEVREVSADECGEFLNKWHLQGRDRAPFRYGLYYQDDLIAVMTFAKPNASRNVKVVLPDTYELSRYAVRADYLCVGGASKLLNHFERLYSPKSIISYADRRWCIESANLYNTLGFQLEKTNRPSYWYVLGNKRVHRFNYTKKRTVKLGGDPNKTEWENMQNMGIDRIWDCGTLRYVKNYNK